METEDETAFAPSTHTSFRTDWELQGQLRRWRGDPLLTLQSMARPNELGEGVASSSIVTSTRGTESKALAGKLPFSNSHVCSISSQNSKATESVSKKWGWGEFLLDLMTTTSEMGILSQNHQAFKKKKRNFVFYIGV